jgi:DNA-binding MarR family transcriptional regulator
MLERYFKEVYTKFKLAYYKKIFLNFETRDASLTVIETYCVEIIHALGHPTINEFARFANISAQNATNKISSLISKGYLTKSQSPTDKREFNLSVTDKFFHYYNISNAYVHEIVTRMRERFADCELRDFERFLEIISRQLMPEIEQLRGEEL